MHALATSWNVAMHFFRVILKWRNRDNLDFDNLDFWYVFCFFLQGTEFEVVRKTKLNQGISLKMSVELLTYITIVENLHIFYPLCIHDKKIPYKLKSCISR